MIRRKGNKKAWALLLVMLALFCAWIPRERAEATAATQGRKLKIVNIDYEEETMTIVSEHNDTCLYYSDAKQKTWECAYGTFGSVTKGNTTYPCAYVLDISWIKKTKDYVLTLKGDVSETVVSVTLPKQQTNFKVAMDYATGQLTYTNYPNNSPSICWRKNGSTKWEVVDSAAIQRFYAKGASLYFRFEQIPGRNETDVGSRPSKEVKLSIAKQAAAPSVTITTTTQVLTLPALLQYQVYEDGTLVGNAGTWTTASSKKLSIPNDIGLKAYYDNTSNPNPKEITIVFRTAATAKKPASMEKTITIKKQEAAPTNANVKIRVASSNALSLSVEEVAEGEGEARKVIIEGASSSNPYEYTIVEPDSTLNLTTATWKAITSTSSIMLNKEKVAPPKSTIYVRKKAHVASDDKSVYYPESGYYSYTVGDYSRASSTVALVDGKSTDYAYKKENEEVINLVKEEGREADGLQFLIVSDMTVSGAAEGSSGDGSSATEATKITVSSIVCNNVALDFECKDYNPSSGEGDAATQADTENPKKEAKLLVKIKPSANFESAALGSTAYPLTITLSNGEVLNDLVKLTILKKAYLKQQCLLNIIEGAKYSSDANPYRFVVVSTRQLQKGTDGNYTMASIKFVKILKENGEKADITPFITQNLNPAEGTIEVILGNPTELSSWNSALKSIQQDKKYSLEITVADATDEAAMTKISTGVEIIYTKEAAIVPGTAWQRTKVLNENLEENLEIKMSYKTPGVSISDVKLVLENGITAALDEDAEIDIMGNCYIDSQYVYAVLSKNKINAIGLTVTAPKPKYKVPYKIQVVFSNGAVVDTGCTITFNK